MLKSQSFSFFSPLHCHTCAPSAPSLPSFLLLFKWIAHLYSGLLFGIIGPCREGPWLWLLGCWLARLAVFHAWHHPFAGTMVGQPPGSAVWRWVAFSVSNFSHYLFKSRSCIFLFCSLPLFETENPLLLDYFKVPFSLMSLTWYSISYFIVTVANEGNMKVDSLIKSSKLCF